MLSTLTKERMEALRYEAGERLYRKFHSMTANRKGRDYFLYQNNEHDKNALQSVVRSLKHERKLLGVMIRTIAQEAEQDQMKLLGMVWSLNRKHGTSFEWFGKYARRKFGEDTINNLRWKDHWQEPVWQNAPWFRDSVWARVHQVHQSEENPAMIAYNRSIDNIRRDIQTRTKPGKYLTQFFSDVLTQDEIRMWAEKQIAYASCTGELSYIENDNEEGWVDIYQRGPNSCMQGEDCVGVYAYPGNGLRLAYIETAKDVQARAIVRNNDDGTPMGYIRIYATEQRWTTKLKDLLDAAGYGTMVNLHGVKLQRVETDHEGNDWVVCPYIDMGSDGTQMVTIYDDHLKIERNGEIRATNTCGSIPLNDGVSCDDCGDFEREEDIHYIEPCERHVCHHCLENNYTYAYGRRDWMDYYPNDDVIYCESDGEYYATQYAENHDVYECQESGNWYHIDDLVNIDTGDYAGSFVHVDKAVRDHITDEWVYEGCATEIDGEWVADDYVTECHITGNSFDTRFGVTLEIGQKRSYYGTPYMNLIYVSPDAWNLDLIRDNFVRCGDLLLPRGYYGNEIVSEFEPSNIEYGDEFESGQFQDLFPEYEDLLAA